MLAVSLGSAGKHAIPNAWVVPAFRSRGYHVVSAAYRFIPHVNLDDIVTDTIDAHAWCRLHLADILAQTDGKVDIDALVVGGDSAGGTLSTLAGHKLSPPPRVVVDVFGVVDLTDPHMTGEGVDPDSPAAVMLRSIPLSGAFTAEQVATALAETDPSKAEVIAPWSWEMDPNMDLATLQSFWGMPSFKVDPAHTLRMDMLLQMSKDSSMGRLLVRPKDAAGHKDLDDSQVLAAQLRKWSSSLMLNDKDNYPPTFFLHGHKDRAVPIAQSQRMAAKLREMGIPTAEAYSPDGDHCFENVIEVSFGKIE